MANNPKAIENLKPFKQGEDERRHMQGRPQKLITQMKEIGYTKSQVEDTMLSMLSLSRKELEKIDRGDEYTIMERTIAGALLKGHDKNSLFNLEMLLTRSPLQLGDVTHTLTRQTKRNN